MEETVEFKKLVSVTFESATIRYDSTCDTITIRSHDYGVGLLDALIKLINRYPVKGLVMDGEIGRIRKPKYFDKSFNLRIQTLLERHGSSTLENVRFVNLNLKMSFLVAVDQATKKLQQTSLKSIDLSGNRFYEGIHPLSGDSLYDGDASTALFSILSRCPKLEELNLGNYHLGVNHVGHEQVFTNFVNTLIQHCPHIKILKSDVSRLSYYSQFQSSLFYFADHHPDTLLQLSQLFRHPDVLEQCFILYGQFNWTTNQLLFDHLRQHGITVDYLRQYGIPVIDPEKGRQFLGLFQARRKLDDFIESTNTIANDVDALIRFIHETDELMRLIRDTGIVQLKTPHINYSNLALEAASHSTTLEELGVIILSGDEPNTQERLSAVCAFIRTCKVKRCMFQLNFLEMEHWVQLSKALCETTGLKEVKLSFNNHCLTFIQTLIDQMVNRNQQHQYFTLRKISMGSHYDALHPTKIRLGNVLDMLQAQDLISALLEPRQIDRVGLQSGMRLITADIIRMLDGYLR